MSDVKIWYMTEEERLAYIAKHPIVPRPREKGDTFADIYSYKKTKKKLKGDR